LNKRRLQDGQPSECIQYEKENQKKAHSCNDEYSQFFSIAKSGLRSRANQDEHAYQLQPHTKQGPKIDGIYLSVPSIGALRLTLTEAKSSSLPLLALSAHSCYKEENTGNNKNSHIRSQNKSNISWSRSPTTVHTRMRRKGDLEKKKQNTVLCDKGVQTTTLQPSARIPEESFYQPQVRPQIYGVKKGGEESLNYNDAGIQARPDEVIPQPQLNTLPHPTIVTNGSAEVIKSQNFDLAAAPESLNSRGRCYESLQKSNHENYQILNAIHDPPSIRIHCQPFTLPNSPYSFSHPRQTHANLVVPMGSIYERQLRSKQFEDSANDFKNITTPSTYRNDTMRLPSAIRDQGFFRPTSRLVSKVEPEVQSLCNTSHSLGTGYESRPSNVLQAPSLTYCSSDIDGRGLTYDYARPENPLRSYSSDYCAPIHVLQPNTLQNDATGFNAIVNRVQHQSQYKYGSTLPLYHNKLESKPCFQRDAENDTKNTNQLRCERLKGHSDVLDLEDSDNLIDF
jgi:hypothetical protein